MTELRAAWLLLAALCILGPWDVVRLVSIGVPWASGAILLASRSRAERAAASSALLFASSSGRMAVIVLAVLLFTLIPVVTLAGALVIVVWVGALALLVAVSRRPETLQQLILGGALAGVTLALTLGVVEALLRLSPLAERFGPPSERAAWTHRYEGQWRTNIFGFRSPYESVARRPDVHRVLALGDSFTWGDKIAHVDSAWPARLERELARRLPDQRFEVINMGENAWTTANEAERLRRLGWQFGPDLVLVQFHPNDAFESGPDFKHETGTATHLLPDWLAETEAPITRSAIIALLEFGWNQFHATGAKIQLYGELYQPGSKGWAQLQEALIDMGDSARVRGVPVVYILFPQFLPGEWTVETYPYRDIYRDVTEAARRADLQVLDLVPTFVARGGNWRRWWATPYDAHPSPAAHAVAAETISNFLARLDWPSQKPTLTAAVPAPTR